MRQQVTYAENLVKFGHVVLDNHANGQTDRQTNKQTNRQTKRQTHRHTNRSSYLSGAKKKFIHIQVSAWILVRAKSATR